MQSTQWLRAVVLAVFDSVEQEDKPQRPLSSQRETLKVSVHSVAKKNGCTFGACCQRLFWAKCLHRRSTPQSGSVGQNERKE